MLRAFLRLFYIKLETTHKPPQGSHLFGKGLFVTFDPANLGHKEQSCGVGLGILSHADYRKVRLYSVLLIHYRSFPCKI